jgi:hypothetical protein
MTELLTRLEEEIARAIDPRRRFILKNQYKCLKEVIKKRCVAERLQAKVEASCLKALETRTLKFASPEDEAEFERAVEDAGEVWHGH